MKISAVLKELKKNIFWYLHCLVARQLLFHGPSLTSYMWNVTLSVAHMEILKRLPPFVMQYVKARSCLVLQLKRKQIYRVKWESCSIIKDR